MHICAPREKSDWNTKCKRKQMAFQVQSSAMYCPRNGVERGGMAVRNANGCVGRASVAHSTNNSSHPCNASSTSIYNKNYSSSIFFR